MCILYNQWVPPPNMIVHSTCGFINNLWKQADSPTIDSLTTDNPTIDSPTKDKRPILISILISFVGMSQTSEEQLLVDVPKLEIKNS